MAFNRFVTSHFFQTPQGAANFEPPYSNSQMHSEGADSRISEISGLPQLLQPTMENIPCTGVVSFDTIFTHSPILLDGGLVSVQISKVANLQHE